MANLSKGYTVCCGVTPKKSTENKPGEKPGAYHYKCPACGRDPVVVANKEN